MSFQQFPPAGDPNSPFGAPPPVVQQPGAPFASSAPAGRRRTGLIAAGALILAAGVAAGIVMLLASGTNYDDSVQSMARAPVGCTTALEFDETGTFTVYVETTGSIGELRGDCPNTDTDYQFSGEVLPAVDIVLTDEEGNDVGIDDDFDKSYDAAGYVGQSIGTVDIDQAGDYDITVASDEDGFAIALGKNPKEEADSLRTWGLVVLIAGVVLGGLLLLLGLRRRRPPTQPPSGLAYGSPAYGGPPQPYAPEPATTVMPPVVSPPPGSWAPAPPPPSPPPSPPAGPSSWPAPPAR